MIYNIYILHFSEYFVCDGGFLKISNGVYNTCYKDLTLQLLTNQPLAE